MLRLFVCLLLLVSATVAARAPIDIITVGTFHFNFPNQDRIKVAAADQIDILAPQYQQQLADIVLQLPQLAPTHVAVEYKTAKAEALERDYQAYLAGQFVLPRSETYQLGFRLAKQAGLPTVYALDTWGAMPAHVEQLINDDMQNQAFKRSFSDHPDTAMRFESKLPITLAQSSLHKALLLLNQPDYLEKNLGNYFLAQFKYEQTPGDYTGADFEAGRWFSRNLRILRNIQRIPAKPGDRIVVIYGNGHLGLLNPWLDASPEYQRIPLDQVLQVPAE